MYSYIQFHIVVMYSAPCDAIYKQIVTLWKVHENQKKSEKSRKLTGTDVTLNGYIVTYFRSVTFKYKNSEKL